MSRGGGVLTRPISLEEDRLRWRRFATGMLLVVIVLLSHLIPSAARYAIEVWAGARLAETREVAAFALQFVAGGMLAWICFLGRYRGRAPTMAVVVVLAALVWAIAGV